MSAAPPPLLDRDAPAFSLLGGVCAMLAMLFVIGILLMVSDGAADGTALIEHQMFVQMIGSLVPIAFAIFWPLRASWLGARRPGLHILGLYVAFLLLWMPLSFVAYPWLLDVLGVTLEAQPHLSYFTETRGGSGYFFVLVTVCLIGPVCEEIVFRGFLQSGLRRMLRPWVAVVVVGILFGFMHGAVLGLPLSLMGMFFGYLRERDDGMLAPILAHILHNSVTVALAAGWPKLISEVYAK